MRSDYLSPAPSLPSQLRLTSLPKARFMKVGPLHFLQQLQFLWVPGNFACPRLSPRDGNRIPSVTVVRMLHCPCWFAFNPAHIFLNRLFIKHSSITPWECGVKDLFPKGPQPTQAIAWMTADGFPHCLKAVYLWWKASASCQPGYIFQLCYFVLVGLWTSDKLSMPHR